MTAPGYVRQVSVPQKLNDLSDTTRALAADRGSSWVEIDSGVQGAPDFENDWANSDDPDDPPCGYMVKGGDVRFRGAAVGGAYGTAAWTMPENLWPRRRRRYPAALTTEDGAATVIVNVDGTVVIESPFGQGGGTSALAYALFIPDATPQTSPTGDLTLSWAPAKTVPGVVVLNADPTKVELLNSAFAYEITLTLKLDPLDPTAAGGTFGVMIARIMAGGSELTRDTEQFTTTDMFSMNEAVGLPLSAIHSGDASPFTVQLLSYDETFADLTMTMRDARLLVTVLGER